MAGWWEAIKAVAPDVARILAILAVVALCIYTMYLTFQWAG